MRLPPAAVLPAVRHFDGDVETANQKENRRSGRLGSRVATATSA
jgi:hypothetical protein